MKSGFMVAPDVIDLIRAAAAKRCDEGYMFLLSGDLSQMSIQKRFLQSQGIMLGQVDVYPAFKTEGEFLDAIRMLWENKIDGWWHYQKEIVEKLMLCSKDDFQNAI